MPKLTTPENARVPMPIPPTPFDDALEAVSVHDVDEQADNNVVGWFGVSTDASGGIIAYFSTERAAYAYRMMLVNHLCNPNGFDGSGES